MSAAKLSTSWGAKRESLLFAACNAIAAMRQDNIPVGDAIKLVAGKFRGRSLGGDRRLPLTRKTMRRHWDRWNSTSPKKRSPAMFRLQYGRPGATKLSPLLVRLIAEFAIQQGRTAGEVLRFIRPENAHGNRIAIRTALRKLPAREIQKLAFAQRHLTKRTRQLAEQKEKLANAVLAGSGPE
jgi:hypothetical protein